MERTKNEARRFRINTIVAAGLGFITPFLNLGWFVRGEESLTWNPIGMLVNIGLIILWNAVFSERVFPDPVEEKDTNTIDNHS